MRFLKLWFPVFAWCGLIFYFSSLPDLTSGGGLWDLILRKAAHITEYFILTFLLYRALEGSFNLSFADLIFSSAFLSLLYAISDEIHQVFVPTRNGNVGDILIDSMGIGAFLIVNLVRNRLPKTSE